MSGGKPAYEPAVDILLGDNRFPDFLNHTYIVMQMSQLEQPILWYNLDVCIESMAKYYRNAAKIFWQPGPLNMETLYKNWPDKTWRPRIETLKPKAGESLYEAGLNELFLDNIREVEDGEPGSEATEMENRIRFK
jgi:hypothetical protein